MSLANSEEIQKAIADIDLIRRMVGKAETKNPDILLFGVNLYTNIVLQSAALLVAGLLTVVEINSPTTASLISAGGTENLSLRMMIVGEMSLVILAIIFGTYFVVWRAAQHTLETFQQFAGRNFQYLKNLSFISDLLVKFSALSFVILAGRVDWTSALLFLFIGDFLIQGRFFTFSIRWSIVLGMACLIGAAIQYRYNFDSELICALVTFCFITALSLGRLIIKRLKSRNESL